MTSLLGDERGGQSQGDEMTFSNIAGVLPAVDKVQYAPALLTFCSNNFLAPAIIA